MGVSPGGRWPGPCRLGTPPLARAGGAACSSSLRAQREQGAPPQSGSTEGQAVLRGRAPLPGCDSPGAPRPGHTIRACGCGAPSPGQKLHRWPGLPLGSPLPSTPPRLSSGLGRDGVKGLRPVSLTSPHARWGRPGLPAGPPSPPAGPSAQPRATAHPHLPCLTCRRLASWAYLAGLRVQESPAPVLAGERYPPSWKGVWLIGRSSSVSPGKDNKKNIDA